MKLGLMDVKVLPQDGKLDAFADDAEVVQGAAEELRLGQDRYRGGASTLELRGLAGVERLVQGSLRGRSTLQLGNDGDRCAPKC